MTWTPTELLDALGRFERELQDARLLPNSIRSYVDYARRFLRWRAGDYRPRDAVGPAHHPSRAAATSEDLRVDLLGYERELRAAGRQPAAVTTYVDHASRFVRWLDGLFVTGGPRAGQLAASRSRTPDDMVWAWEGHIQAALVAWLEGNSWTIERQANTRAREHGVDVIAVRGDDRLAIEVKGYPQTMLANGQPRKWHRAAQARTYFGTALHTALIMRDARPDSQVAIAFPDVAGYRHSLDQVRASLTFLGVRMLLVRADGSVLEPYSTAIDLPSAGARRVR